MSTSQVQPVFVSSEQSSTDLPQQDDNGKLPFTPPELTFVTPKLTKQGRIENITAGIAGTFSP